VLDDGFGIELCTPRSPEQQGSVENLAAFVQRACFRARRFVDVDTDLPRQLTEWLVEVNEVRPPRPGRAASGAHRRRAGAHEALATAPADYGLKVPVTIGPTAMVSYQGVHYAMRATACGLPATRDLDPSRVRIVCAGGKHESAGAGRWRREPGRRRAVSEAEADARDHEQAAGGVGAGAACW
jgi:hypothetical protein